MNVQYVKDKMLEELWDNHKFNGVIFDDSESAEKGNHDDYLNVEKQIDIFLSNIQSTGSLGWFRMDMFSDDDIVGLGVDFINRDGSRRKLFYNISNHNDKQIIEAIEEKLNYYNPTMTQYKELAENSDEIEKIMTLGLSENIASFNKEYVSLTDTDNTVNIESARDIFHKEAQFYILKYETAIKNGILYEETDSLNCLIYRANLIFSNLLENIMIDYNKNGLDIFDTLVNICQNIYNYNAVIANSTDAFNNAIISKIKGSSCFLRLSYIFLNGYLCRKCINQTTNSINQVLVQEVNANPKLFTPKGYFDTREQANARGEIFYTEGTAIADVKAKIKNAYEIARKFIVDENNNYFFQKVVFREAYIAKTPYNGKKTYTSILVNKILKNKELTFEERIFFQSKIQRGKMREFNLLDNYPAFIKVISAAADVYLEVFKILDFKICIEQINVIFQQLMSYLLEAYK